MGVSRTVSQCSQAGFTVLEVLITMLVLAIGLLGLAGLQTFSVQANREAVVRSQAISLAYDMADRMRANSNEAESGAYNIPLGAVGCDPALTLGGPHTTAADRDEWMNMIACLLPGGQGGVAQNADDITITVAWEDRNINAVSPDTTVIVRTRFFGES